MQNKGEIICDSQGGVIIVSPEYWVTNNWAFFRSAIKYPLNCDKIKFLLDNYKINYNSFY